MSASLHRAKLLVGLCAALGSGCAEPPAPLAHPDAAAATDAGVEPLRDAGTLPDAAIPEDAGTLPDAEPGMDATSTTTPVRRLRARPLFGDLPVENRVHNAVFDLSTSSWLAYPQDPAAMVGPALVKVALPESPRVAPLVRVDKNGEFGATIMGVAKASGHPLEVSIYLGRAQGVSDPLRASVVGIGADGAELAYDLGPSGDAPLELAGVVWTRLSVRVELPTEGWLSLIVDDPGLASSWVQAPVVLPAPPARRLGPPALARSPTGRERWAMRKYAEEQRRHLGPPARVPPSWPRP